MAWEAACDKAAMPKGAWSTAWALSSVWLGACCSAGKSASFTVSERHLGRPASHRLEHAVSCLMSGIGEHWIARRQAMTTISTEGSSTEAECGITIPS
jgi:hypothetical protein